MLPSGLSFLQRIIINNYGQGCCAVVAAREPKKQGAAASAPVVALVATVGPDRGMPVKSSSREEALEATCMPGAGNLGRKRVEWRRNANLPVHRLPPPAAAALEPRRSVYKLEPNLLILASLGYQAMWLVMFARR